MDYEESWQNVKDMSLRNRQTIITFAVVTIIKL